MYTQNCCILPRLGSYPEICAEHPEVLYELGESGLEERLSYFIELPERRRAVATELSRRALKFEPARVVATIARVLRELHAEWCARRRAAP
jgi:hypothetical protein